MTANEQYDITIFFKSGVPIVLSWLFLLILAVIFSALGTIFDGKEKKSEKTIVRIFIKNSNRYMATMFLTAWLILSFIIYRWIL